MSREVAIIIPVYRKTPNNTEQKSLDQCFKILKSHPIIFFCAHTFDSSYYEEYTNSQNILFQKKTFHPKYFKDKKGYNSLCLSQHFYTEFLNFDYVLIYQLDAWVFKDELNFWCSLGYDYIGAPFPVDFNAKQEDVTFSVVGNGGFSLRKVTTIVNLLNDYKRIKNWNQLLAAYNERIKKNKLIYLYIIIRFAGFRNNIGYLKKDIWEDHFFSEIARLTSFIKMPSSDIALAFSFEYRPSAAFSINNNNLPFGCHGWNWIEYEEFWKNYIEIN